MKLINLESNDAYSTDLYDRHYLTIRRIQDRFKSYRFEQKTEDDEKSHANRNTFKSKKSTKGVI